MRSSGFGVLLLGALAPLFFGACSSSSGDGNSNAPDAATTECTSNQILDPSSQQCIRCADDTKPSSDGSTCVTLGWQNCPAGFVLDPTGYGCIDVSPAADCAVGTMPTIGSTTCKPVGTTSCATGFSADPSGWGCAAVAPPAACTGATKETLGSATCAPVGDCSATFPPTAATLFVSPSAVVDATHFKTISAAVAAATDGVTISIDAGTYAESVSLTHAVHLAGRCAAQVTIDSGVSTPGISIAGISGASVSGVTISGNLQGVSVSSAGSITLSAVVLDGNSAAGVGVSGASKIEIDDSVVRGSIALASAKGDGVDLTGGSTAIVQRSAIVHNTEEGIYASDPGTTLTVTNSIVSDNVMNAAGNFGVGVDVVTSAMAEVDGSSIVRNQEAGLVSAAAAKLTINQSVIANTIPSTAGFGHGVTVDGATLDIEESTVAANVDVGISVESPPGAITAKNTVFRAQLPNSDKNKGTGVAASSGGVATLTGVALVGNSEEGAFADGTGSTLTMIDSIARDGVMLAGNTAGNGVVAQNGGKLILQGAAIIANHESGLLMFDPVTSAQVTQSIIARQLPSLGTQFGRGIVLQNGPSLIFNQSVVSNNTDIGISSTGKGSILTMNQSVVRDTASQISDGTHGRALNIIEQSQATVTDSEIYDNAEVAAFVSGTSAQLTMKTSVIAHTQLDTKSKSAGRGFAAQNSGIGVLSGCVVSDNFQAGISSAGASATLTVDTTLVDETNSIAGGAFGHGVLAIASATIALSTTTVSRSAGVGVIVDASTATLSACNVVNNNIGINAQDGSTLNQVATIPDPPNPLDVDVSSDTVFGQNQTQIGSGSVPIPNAIGN